MISAVFISYASRSMTSGVLRYNCDWEVRMKPICFAHKKILLIYNKTLYVIKSTFSSVGKENETFEFVDIMLFSHFYNKKWEPLLSLMEL